MWKNAKWMNESEGEFCPVGGKNLWFSLVKTKLTTRQNRAVHQRETGGVAGKSGPGRGVPGSFFLDFTPTPRAAPWLLAGPRCQPFLVNQPLRSVTLCQTSSCLPWRCHSRRTLRPLPAARVGGCTQQG